PSGRSVPAPAGGSPDPCTSRTAESSPRERIYLVPMRAMVLHATGEPLRLEEVPVPEPEPGQVRLQVAACGVCRTDLHVVDGELPDPKLPLVPGHQVVGRTEDGRRLGVPWLGWTDGTCRYCPP